LFNEGTIFQKETIDYNLDDVEILKVSSNSVPKSVAGALASVMRRKDCALLQAVGAGAVNQAIKAISVARGYVAPMGIDLVCVPEFSETEIDGSVKTAIRFCVMKR